MIKRLLSIVMLLSSASLFAQENLLDRIIAANLHPTLKAGFVQIRHSPMLTEDLLSEGLVYLQQPDKIRWDILKPSPHTTIFNGEKPNERCFRLPGQKDFSVSEIRNDDLCFVTLVPVRSDLKRLFSRIILQVKRDSLLIQEIQLHGYDGDYTVLQFNDVKFDIGMDPQLFIKD